LTDGFQFQFPSYSPARREWQDKSQLMRSTFELDSATANHSSIGICHVCGIVMSNGVHWTLWESMTNNVVIATGWLVMPVYVGW
jgi:hypothetical protein